MDIMYRKLNKKLDTLTQHTQTAHDNTRDTHTQPRLINLTNTKFTKEQISTLALGPNYALEKDPKHYINELIIDTENAIRQLDPKVHNTFQYMATTKIKQIMTSSTHHTLYRRHQYNLNQIRKTLQRNNLTIARAD
jgi:tRNA U34 5-carboxymethylaminomethyl modifying GTPase MnmE/TrmE